MNNNIVVLLLHAKGGRQNPRRWWKSPLSCALHALFANQMNLKKKLSGLASSAHETNNKTQWVNLRRASNINQVIQVFPLPFNFLHEIWCRPGAPRSFRRKRRSGSALSILHLGWAWISYLFWETCVQILGSSMYVAGSEAPGMPSAISRKRRGKMPSPGNQNVLDGL